MSYQSEKEEDDAFNSLSESQKRQYFKNHEESGDNVRESLDAVLGPVWFNRDGSPRGDRIPGRNDQS